MLGLSLGASAVYSIVSIVARVTDERPLAEQSAAINQSRSSREWLDFTYQFLDVFFGLFVVALALVAVIGIPGIALYALGRLAGWTVAVVASPLDAHWWTVPILVLAALKAALTEEVIVVGYLFTRLRELGVGAWATILSSAVLRGTYHLYQGFGPFAGNVAMGIVFGWCYQRWGRTMPLVIAHWMLDMISFIGYPLAVGWWPELFAPPE